MGFKSKIKRFFELEEEAVELNQYEGEQYEEDFEEIEEYPKVKKKNNVVSLQSIQKNVKVILVEPRVYSEVQDIADQLKNHRAVVMNLQRVPRDQAKRIVDFLSGTVYAIGGDIQKLGDNAFLCSPNNVDVTGNISELFQED
ncbi:cell division protein SepF [Bacillus taeanensis]|uniref:Cell division protein SepF n=1 Tax=Bacillus taeanensis TaxID=273032 RepID=A0A366XRF7_9BACI|nr:cell division protein SepF [Bacillus taeanensis]RBW67359.1 cell division protein SepF [Bacillus taeanensis]